MAKKRRMKRSIATAVVPSPSRLSKKQKKVAKEAVRPASGDAAAAADAAAVSPGGGSDGGGGGGPGNGHDLRDFRSGPGGGGGGGDRRDSVGRSATQARHREWVPRDWESAPSAPGSRHSTTYAQAADILSTILSATDGDAPPPSPTALCLAPHVTNKRAVYALVISTLRHRVLLADVAIRGRLGTISPRLDANPALGLRALGRARPNLAAALRGVLRDAGVETAEELALARLAARPRYVRANALKGGTLGEVLRARGSGPAASAPRAIPVGPPFSDLVRVPPGMPVHDHPLLSSGRAMVQGKSSCLPVVALLDSLAGGPPIAGWTAADATAAPGNKTVQLAAALVAADAGPVIAVERDATRLRTLRSTLSRAGANRAVRVVRGTGSPTTLERRWRAYSLYWATGALAVEGAGGGSDIAYQERLARLAAMQSRMLARALAIPSARRVVYSTCSVETVENESVVAAALNDAGGKHPGTGGDEAATTWRLHPALPSWRRRGLLVHGVPEAVSRACLRVDEEEDETDGRLVARTGAKDALVEGEVGKGGAMEPIAGKGNGRDNPMRKRTACAHRG
ncbi:hypothetical protein MMPV_009942 [Pyropia vietnamensis]